MIQLSNGFDRKMVYLWFIALEGFDTHRVVGELARIYLNVQFTLTLWKGIQGNLGEVGNKDNSPKSLQGVDFGFCP